MKFGENLYHLRKDAKMSQEVLAEKVGVSRQSVSKWENGEAYPEMDNLLKICKIFHCKLNDIIHDDIQDIDSLDEDVKMSIVKFEKEKQKRLKVISKIISIIAVIGKICARVGVAGLIVAMVVFNIFVSWTNIKNENEFEFHLGELYFNYQNYNNEIKVTTNISNEKPEENDNITLSKISSVLAKHNKTEILILGNLALIIFIASLILLSISLMHLEKLFKNIYDGNTPFTLDNVYHIKKMTYLMIAITILSACGNGVSSLIIKDDLDMNMGFSLITILFLYSIAYIFEYGYHIQENSNERIYDIDDDSKNENKI